MNIRQATIADEAALRELTAEYEAEVPEPPGYEPDPWAEAWVDLQRSIEQGLVFIAEDDEGEIGLLVAVAETPRRWKAELVVVRPRARKKGVATALLRALTARAAAEGVEYLALEVVATNDLGRTVWNRLGFEPVELLLTHRVDALTERLDPGFAGESHAAVHVQSDDLRSIERAVARFTPRLEAPVLHQGGNGWVRVSDPALDADREAQKRLARELSERLGAVVVALALELGQVVRFLVYERGLMVDEYLSVPGFYGPISKVDELALAVNPTVVSRLTGADREELKRVVRTAERPGDLPPAPELHVAIATCLGLEP